MTILCYDRCTTCQKALKWLDLKGADYTVRPIKEEHPNVDELRAWWKQSGLPLRRFFNTSGQLYQSMRLRDRLPGMSEEEQLRLLASDGMLVKRPIVVRDDLVLVGFRPGEWDEKL